MTRQSLSPKPQLSWRAALRIAWREMRASRAKFLFVVLSVAIGVGSLTGVRGFSSSFRHMLLGEARTLMAGDLTARVFALPTAEQETALRGLEARGVRRTWITETVTMASSASTADPLLISVKAVDPAAYPYYGVVKLNPPRPLREALDARGISYCYLDGQTRDRERVVDRFQNDDTVSFFLISLKAGGVGLNLTAADYVIHIDPWWNPAVEMQATDRTHRIGQDKPVFVYKLIAQDSVEEKILQLQEHKRALVEQVIGAEGGVFKSLTREDIEVLFS